MSASPPQTDDKMRRLTEATAWRVRLTEAGLESSPAFEAWAADSQNAAAWAQVQGPWRRMGEDAGSHELMAARAGALARARERGRRRWRGAGFTRRHAAGLLAVALIGGGYGGWRWHEAQPRIYRTTLGERRVVPLSDGSIVSLDSGSEVHVRYTRDARRLELISGQARFDVAPDVLHPFSVKARDQTVVATGTAFNVDLLGPRVVVTLIEGRVTVLNAHPTSSSASLSRSTPPKAQTPTLTLTSGQQLVVAPATSPTIAAIATDRATAWQDGQLIFEDEPLSMAAERVSRYTDQPVTTDGQTGALRISGMFKSGDVATFIDAVTHYFPVEARTDAKGAVTLRRKG